MATQVIKKRQQATGAFDFGRILENKPLGFPHEGGLTKAASNLFYWAHAWSDTGGLIDKHPHQGFEIMSYVIEGTIAHYDNKMDDWKQLHKGDAQLIKAGDGIMHAEKLLPGAHIFQIWFDPDLNKTLRKPAAYEDVSEDRFPITHQKGYSTKVIVGEGSPMELDAVGVEVLEYRFEAGEHALPLSADSRYGFYLVSGNAEAEGEGMEQDDYLQVTDAEALNLKTESGAVLFAVAVPAEVDYKTYASRHVMA